MKKIILLAIMVICMTSCKLTYFDSNNAHYGQLNQTQVVLKENNFKVLGSFQGQYTTKVRLMNIKDKEGLVSAAKQEFLRSAREAGVNLTGSRAIINPSVDIVKNKRRITVTFSAEIIEFTR